MIIDSQYLMHNVLLLVGTMIHQTGSGPKPIPHAELHVENLRDAIKFATSADAKAAAARIAESIRNEVRTCSSDEHLRMA